MNQPLLTVGDETPITASVDSMPIVFSMADAGIQAMAERFKDIDAKSDYEACRVAIAECRSARVAIEKRRKELKEDSLRYGRKVDAEAKRLTEAIEKIEVVLVDSKAVVDQEKERAKQEAARILREKQQEEMRKQAEEAARVQEEHRKQQEAALAAERNRIAAERAKLQAERDKLEQERKQQQEALDRQREAQEEANRAQLREQLRVKEELDRQRESLRKEQEAELARKQKEVAEQQAKIKQEQEAQAQREAEKAAEKARLEAMPVVQQIIAFAAVLRGLELPASKTKVSNVACRKFLTQLGSDLSDLAKRCEQFKV